MGGGSDAADAEFVVISASVVVAGSAVVVCASFASLVLPPPLVSFFLHGVHGSKLKRLLSVAMSAEISPSSILHVGGFYLLDL